MENIESHRTVMQTLSTGNVELLVRPHPKVRMGYKTMHNHLSVC